MKNCRYAACVAFVCILCGCGNTDYGLCILSSERKLESNAGRFFPMHSIVKFPQALYVADYLYDNEILLDSAVAVHKEELMQDTWSPMLVGMDESQTFSIRELLRLSLIESDNNACDLLFRLCGSPGEVDSFVKGLGFGDINVSVTERQIHDDVSLAAENCCTPSEMARLLLWFNEHKDDNAYFREIWNIMASCNTGADRIPAAFGDDCMVIHKTGAGFAPADGLPQINDAGIVIHPDGEVTVVAVFVPHPATLAELAEIIKTLLN